MSAKIKKGWKEDKKGIIGFSVFCAFVVVVFATAPLTIHETISIYKDQIAQAKTCSDVIDLSSTNIVTANFIQMFDFKQEVKTAIDEKAHVLCKPLYDISKKYGYLTLDNLSKITCSDLGSLIKTVPTKQEVINEYVKRCEVK